MTGDVLFDPPGQVMAGARLSDDGRYRYTLSRLWDPAFPGLLWLMLNPSTADAAADDPTIRRVTRFTRDAGYGGFTAVNLYALRATDPKALRNDPDPVGPDNDTVLAGLLNTPAGRPVVCAWGAHPAARARVPAVAGLLDNPVCLGVTAGGHPKHPLYVPAAARLLPYPRKWLR